MLNKMKNLSTFMFKCPEKRIPVLSAVNIQTRFTIIAGNTLKIFLPLVSKPI